MESVGAGVQKKLAVAVFVGVPVREGVGVAVHVGRVKVPVGLAVAVAVEDGGGVRLAVLVSVGVLVMLAVSEGVGETISTVGEAVTSASASCGVRLGGRGIAVSKRLLRLEASHPDNPTKTIAMNPISFNDLRTGFIAAGTLLDDYHSSRVTRLRLQI